MNTRAVVGLSVGLLAGVPVGLLIEALRRGGSMDLRRALTEAANQKAGMTANARDLVVAVDRYREKLKTEFIRVQLLVDILRQHGITVHSTLDGGRVDAQTVEASIAEVELYANSNRSDGDES